MNWWHFEVVPYLAFIIMDLVWSNDIYGFFAVVQSLCCSPIIIEGNGSVLTSFLVYFEESILFLCWLFLVLILLSNPGHFLSLFLLPSWVIGGLGSVQKLFGGFLGGSYVVGFWPCLVHLGWSWFVAI